MQIGLDPIVFAVGPLAVRWFGVLAIAGLGLGVWLMLRDLRDEPLARRAALNALAWALPVGVLSARLVYVVSWWDFFLTRPSDVWQLHLNGLSVWGGLVGGGLAAAIALRREPALRRRVLSAAAPGLALALAIGSFGAFVDGHGQGLPSNLMWATTYTHPLSSAPDFGVPRHPVQVYEGLIALGLFLLLTRLPGEARFLTFGLLFATARVALGGVRLEPAFLFGVQLELMLAAAALVTLAVAGVRRLRAAPLERRARVTSQRTDSLAA